MYTRLILKEFFNTVNSYYQTYEFAKKIRVPLKDLEIILMMSFFNKNELKNQLKIQKFSLRHKN